MPTTPTAAGLPGLLRELGRWQRDGVPLPLHPGDLGWATRLGVEETAAATRAWTRGGSLVAVGLLDGPDVLRLAVAPEHADDARLAAEVAGDLAEGELAGVGDVEARLAPALADELGARGWGSGDAWVSLALDLGRDLSPVPDEVPDGVRVEVVDATSAHEWAAVLASAFGGTYDADAAVRRWRHLAEGPASAGFHPLLLRGGSGAASAVVGAWSAGAGRPGLLEPLGVHADHRGQGLGRAATLAAAEALARIGCSSATVATPAANAAAVATYLSAGCRQLAVTHDLRRPG